VSSLELAAFVAATVTEGPHRRCAVWVQGCTLACPGCCNPDMFRRGRGTVTRVADLLGRIEAARDRHDLEGLTVLGGEPLQQLAAVADLVAGARALGLGTLVFTGYTFDEARARPGFASLWGNVDTLVDGRYDARAPEPRPGRAVVGSKAQRILHRTLRYADPALWRGPRRAEVRVGPGGVLDVVGFPTAVATLTAALAGARLAEEW
jgi:anaerobic ribonucleoside-triphosphate reductase activating protein